MIKNDEIRDDREHHGGQDRHPRVATPSAAKRCTSASLTTRRSPRALATCEALDHLDAVEVNRLQDLHKEARRHETDSDDAARRRSAAQRAQAAQGRGPPARHQGDRRGAQPRRPVARTPSITPRASSRASSRGASARSRPSCRPPRSSTSTSLTNTGKVIFGATVDLEDQDDGKRSRATRSSARTRPTSRAGRISITRRSRARWSASRRATSSTWSRRAARAATKSSPSNTCEQRLAASSS